MEIEQEIWGFAPEGEAIIRYTMRNSIGASVQVINIGASVVSVVVPDRDGTMADVALGYQDPLSYFGDAPAMGKSVGRFANRIALGVFTLDGKEYRLAQNNGVNHLHGGLKGFASCLWESRVEVNRVVMTLNSPDGDQGYPGTLAVEAVFDWDDDCVLEITYRAKSFAPTIVNLTNHTYFNLAGHDSGSIEGHTLQLNCGEWLPTDATQIPTGEIASVDGTPMDFRAEKPVGRDIAADHDAIRIGHGYDHCWVVDAWSAGRLHHIGTLADPVSGRMMDVISTQPGVQVYTGNFLQGAPIGKGGRPYENRAGIAIECQGYPDAPNKPQFPSARLSEDEVYEQSILYRFSTDV